MKSEQGDSKRLMCSVKLYSCLLCSVHELLEPSLREKFRSLNCLLRTLRNALDEDELELAAKVQEHADRVFKSLETISSTFEEEVLKQFRKVKAELFITKMQLSVLEGDVQMAKFYEERAEIIGEFCDGGEVVMETLRMIYNSSLVLYDKGQHEDVMHFLQKAMKMTLDSTIDGVDEIKVSVCSLLAHSCIAINTEASLDLADQAIKTIETTSSTPSIETFKLGIQLSKNRDSMMDMEDILMRMIMTIPIVANLKQILGIINDFTQSHADSAIKCFEYLFTNRLEPSLDQEAMEMVLVALVNAHVKDKVSPVPSKIDRLVKFFDDAERILMKAISKKCSSSSVTLLWTSGKTECKNNNFKDAIGWFQLGLHRLLQLNDIDKAKFQRALQNCFVQLDEDDKALAVFDQMSLEAQNSLITQYNNFKIYLHQNNEIEMMASLQRLVKFDEKNVVPLLSLCAINCERNTRMAIESMLCVFQKVQQGFPTDISIPNTLKFVIELIQRQDITMQDQYKDTLLTLLQEAQSFEEKNHTFTIEELKWFCASSFNLSRDSLKGGSFRYGDLFASVSTELNILIKDDVSISESLTLKLWRFRSGLISIMCQSQLTTVDHDTLWSDIRSRSLNLRIMIDEMIIVSQGYAEYIKHFRRDWERCLLDCMIFQCQAELELGNQNAVETIVQEANKYRDVDFDGTLVNLVWSSSQPSRLKAHVLSMVIERHLSELSTPCTIISRWVRLFLKQESDQSVQRVISQLIMRLNSQPDANRFPVHEIEWMSSRCWNRGVALMFQNERPQGSIWCNYAMRLAQFVNERFETTLNKLWDELA